MTGESCITGIEREGDVYAAKVNRAKPDAEELAGIFAGHIAQGALLLCDGLKMNIPVSKSMLSGN